MGRLRSLLSVLTIIVLGASAQAAEPAAEPASETITFADNSEDRRQIIPSLNGLGVSARLMGGFGVLYERLVGPRTRVYSDIYYAGDAQPLLAEFSKSNTVGAMDVSEAKRLSLSIGVDRFFFLTDDGRWSFITGLGAGYQQSEVKTKFYPAICGLWCGFDMNNPLVDKTEQDSAVSLLFRTGLRYSGLRAYGVKADCTWVLVAQVARSPAITEIIVPDGRRLRNPRSSGYLGLETVLGF